MRILALVIARGGSKRLPGKNIRMLGGRPLIAWTIEAVAGLAEVCDILVSTDSETIAAAARRAGAYVPWLRPPELATDTASSVDVCLHALDWYEHQRGSVDGVLLLQPSSPFRRKATIRRGLEIFEQNGRRPVVGVSAAGNHPFWCFKVEGMSMTPFCEGSGTQLRSQDLPPAYAVNGAFYAISPSALRQRRSFFGPEAMALIIADPDEAVDIDTETDWRVAEAILGGQDTESRKP